MPHLYTISSLTRRYDVAPRIISDLFYSRKLSDTECPIVDGRRMIPESYIPTVEAVLRAAGKHSPEHPKRRPMPDAPLDRPPDPPALLVSAEELARLLEVSQKTFRRWDSSGITLLLNKGTETHVREVMALRELRMHDFLGWKQALEFNLGDHRFEQLKLIRKGADSFYEYTSRESADNRNFKVLWEIECCDERFHLLDLSVIPTRPNLFRHRGDNPENTRTAKGEFSFCEG